MLSVFDRIRHALAEGKALSKTELFLEASIPNTDSNKALFQILVQNNKLIPTGKGRARKYSLPLNLDKSLKDGEYEFSQVGDGLIKLNFEQDDTIIFQNYEECVIYIKRRFTNG
jgi:hypothetical protein